MSRSEINISRWLEAHTDRSAGLTTLPRNAVLADVSGDGEYRLVLTDLKLDKESRCKLKIYKGTLLTSDQVLQDIPSSLISFYADQLEPRIPAVAVACGTDLFVFKNSKPFYKFRVPPIVVTPLESEIWKRLKEDKQWDILKGIQELETIPFHLLSSRSQHLLSLPLPKAEEFVQKCADTQPTKENPITCMTVMKKSAYDNHAVSYPIIATEFGIIYCLDGQSFNILHQANTCSIKATPFIIHCTGMYDIEYRIIVACREGSICILRKGWLEGKLLFQTTTDIVDMVVVPGDNFIIIATTDKMLHCFTKRGQRLWSTKMINSVTCLCLVPLQHLSTHLVAVGLKGGPIHLYQGRHAVDFTSVPDTPSTIVFGQLGQEEHVMVIITLGGSITFKILKRTADFSLKNQEGNPSQQCKPLPLPKRSKLFLEQSLRERENALDMHQNFQQDLIRLRLTTARALVQNLSDSSGVGNEKEQIKLSAQVLGLGPKFTIILTLENMNSEKAIVGFTVVFHTNPEIYSLSTNIASVPLVPPCLSYKMETKAEEKATKDLENDPTLRIIRVFVIRNKETQPVLAASINMPTTEYLI